VLHSPYDEFDARTDEGNSELINTPRLICSLESLPRLSGMKRADGSLHRAHYDLIIMDEMMQLHSIFHGATMNDKRRTVLELIADNNGGAPQGEVDGTKDDSDGSVSMTE
jgi:hypothetical protein